MWRVAHVTRQTEFRVTRPYPGYVGSHRSWKLLRTGSLLKSSQKNAALPVPQLWPSGTDLEFWCLRVWKDKFSLCLGYTICDHSFANHRTLIPCDSQATIPSNSANIHQDSECFKFQGPETVEAWLISVSSLKDEWSWGKTQNMRPGTDMHRWS